jgi:hypothetical protein
MTFRPVAATALRNAVQSLITGAVQATEHPHLVADSIEVDQLTPEHGAEVGLRVFLYHPQPGQFEQWAEVIGSHHRGDPKPTSRDGEVRRTAVGRVGASLVEVTCVSVGGPQ